MDRSQETGAYISAPPSDMDDDGRDVPRQLEEDELVASARRGDKEAFGVLYRRYLGPVHKLAGFYLPDAADDVAAEVFLRAWKNLSRYEQRGARFVSWLYGITRHVVADELRKRGRTEPRDEVPETLTEDHTALRMAIRATIDRLPDDQRRVVEMKYLMGLRNPEVAEIMSKSVGAVNALQWRALRSMREWMDEGS
jgi:RNA polymerase sigma-70 factor (ECF subfamily)